MESVCFVKGWVFLGLAGRYTINRGFFADITYSCVDHLDSS